MYYITAIHLEEGEEHKHIKEVKLFDSLSERKWSWLVEDVIVQLRILPDTVYVKDRDKDISVVIVEATPPYIRAKADGKLTNNLLELPRY